MPKILVIEDNEVNREALARQLERRVLPSLRRRMVINGGLVLKCFKELLDSSI